MLGGTLGVKLGAMLGVTLGVTRGLGVTVRGYMRIRGYS